MNDAVMAMTAEEVDAEIAARGRSASDRKAAIGRLESERGDAELAGNTKRLGEITKAIGTEQAGYDGATAAVKTLGRRKAAIARELVAYRKRAARDRLLPAVADRRACVDDIAVSVTKLLDAMEGLLDAHGMVAVVRSELGLETGGSAQVASDLADYVSNAVWSRPALGVVAKDMRAMSGWGSQIYDSWHARETAATTALSDVAKEVGNE